jgi:hypothetical protein
MSNSTITLKQTIDFCSTHADLVPLVGVGGITNEPAISICNDTLADLLTFPNDWKFNSIFMNLLVLTPNKQDYIFGGASAFTLGSSSSGACIDLASNSAITVSGGVVTVKTTDGHRFNVGDTVYLTGVKMTTGDATKYTSTFTDDGSTSTWSGGWVITAKTSTSFSFAATAGQNNADVGGAPGITDFGWISEAAMVEMNNNSSPQNVKHLKAVKGIPVWSKVADPEKVAMIQDRGDGTLLFRFYYVPGTTLWGIKLVYQGKAPLKTDLSQTWAPFPDHYGAVIRQAVLYRMYRYINSPRAEAEYLKLQQEIQKAQGFDDNEESNVYLQPEDTLIDVTTYWTGF